MGDRIDHKACRLLDRLQTLTARRRSQVVNSFGSRAVQLIAISDLAGELRRLADECESIAGEAQNEVA